MIKPSKESIKNLLKKIKITIKKGIAFFMDQKNMEQTLLTKELFEAIEKSKCNKKVIRLVQKGADINARTICYNIPLMFAVENDDEDTAEYLIDKGANIDALFEDDGTSILTHVVLKNYPTIFKLFVSKGAALNFGVHKLTLEMQNYADTAKVVDSLFIEGAVINQEESRNIDEDIFLSRYKKLLINKGYLGSCQQNINNLNLYCPASSEEKNELIALIKENQEKVNMHFASVFYELLNLSTPIPLTLFCESRKNFSSNEISTEIEQLIKYYNNNTSLKADYIKNYLQNDALNQVDKDAFKNAVTQANIEIFQNNCTEIINNLRSEHIIKDSDDLFLPRKVQELISGSFQSSKLKDTEDIEVVGDNQE